MCKRTASLLIFMSLIAPSAHGAADFYGIKMKSEDFAQNIDIRENNLVPDFSQGRPGTDKRIYAYAYVSDVVGSGRGVSIQVYNHSEKPLATEKIFRDLTLVTWTGKRYDRSHTEMMRNRDSLGPGENATFNFSFPGIRVPRDQIRMMICSFDLGTTMIILLPLRPESPKAAFDSNENKRGKLFDFFKQQEDRKKAEPAPTPTPKLEKKVSQSVEAPGKMTTADHCCETPMKIAQSFFQGLGDSLRGKKKEGPMARSTEAAAEPVGAVIPEAAPERKDRSSPPFYPLVKSTQVINRTSYNFLPAPKKKAQSIEGETQEVLHRDRPWSLDNPDRFIERREKLSAIPELPRNEAQVVHANLEYGFVVVNAGVEDGLDKNKILEVLRNGRKIGKVMVTKAREKISGAVILPEWKTRDEIRVGDRVGVSP